MFFVCLFVFYKAKCARSKNRFEKSFLYDRDLHHERVNHFYKKSPLLMIESVLNNKDKDFRMIRMVLAFQVRQQKSLST